MTLAVKNDTVAIALAEVAPRAVPWRLYAGLSILAVYVVLAVVSPLIVPHDPLAQSLGERLHPPSGEHLLGTDALGRDVLSRLLLATHLDLPIGVAAASLSSVIGVALGVTGGLLGRWVDALLMRIGDLALAFPSYVLIIALITIIGPGIGAVLVSFALLGWVPYARLMRAEVKRVKTEPYVLAARLAGIAQTRLVFRHVLPNAIRPALSFFVLDIMFSILALASLSYLGLGIQPPAPEWGTMVAEGQPYLQTHWWLTVAPGAAIAVLGLGFLLVGKTIDDRIQA